MSKNRVSYYEPNHDRFKLHDVNRETDDSQSKNHIKEMSDDMVVNGFRSTEPIIVTKKDRDGKYWIIDGQHRWLAAQMANVPLYYTIDEDVKLSKQSIFDAFLKYNQHKKTIRKNDYIHGYSEMGNESFQILEEFGNKFPMFSLTERMMLLQNSGTKHPDKKQFQKGKFDVGDVKKAEELANYLLEIKPLFEKGYNKSNFVRTILTIFEKKKGFKFDEFIHKVKLRPGSIYLCGDKRSYSEMIHDIYNYRRRENEKIDLRLF